MLWLVSVMDRPFRFLVRLIFTPILLGWMIGPFRPPVSSCEFKAIPQPSRASCAITPIPSSRGCSSRKTNNEKEV